MPTDLRRTYDCKQREAWLVRCVRCLRCFYMTEPWLICRECR